MKPKYFVLFIALILVMTLLRIYPSAIPMVQASSTQTVTNPVTINSTNNTNVFKNAKTFTFSGWVNFKPNNPERYIAWGDGVDFRVGYQRIAFGLKTKYGFGVYRLTPGQLQGGVWRLVTFTYDGQDQKIYLDGELLRDDKGNSSKRVGAMDSTHFANSITFGKTNVSQQYEGDMQDLRFYNQVLSDDQIRQLFKQGRNVNPTPTPSVTPSISPVVTPTPLPSPSVSPSPIPTPSITPHLSFTNSIQKGFSFYVTGGIYFSDPKADESLTNLSATKANWISLIARGYQSDYKSTTLVTTAQTSTDLAIIHGITQAHKLGLKVMLKPHLDLIGDPKLNLNIWRGNIGDGFTTEKQWTDWFASYQSYIIHEAQIAQNNGVEEFAVGTELDGTVKRSNDWRTLIKAVRGVYKGPIVYASDYSSLSLPNNVNWWNEVDYIGVDDYLPLTNKNNPTVAEIKTAWAANITNLQSLSKKWNKQILITEIGYRSIDGTNKSPSTWWTTGAVDLQEQADVYEAALESVYNQPWFAGIYSWAWTTDPNQGGACDTDYTVVNKPAENILRLWYGGSERAISKVCKP